MPVLFRFLTVLLLAGLPQVSLAVAGDDDVVVMMGAGRIGDAFAQRMQAELVTEHESIV